MSYAVPNLADFHLVRILGDTVTITVTAIDAIAIEVSFIEFCGSTDFSVY